MRTRSRWMDPAWLKAPLLYLRFPALALSLVAAVAILGATTAAAPLLLSSAGNAALEQELDQLTDEQAGLRVSTFGFINRETYGPANEQVEALGERMPSVGEPLLTVEGANTRVENAAREDSAVRLLARTNALANIEKLTPDRGLAGAWIADTNARELRVGPGDEVILERNFGTTRIPIAGIYRNLAAGPISEYWRPLTFHIINPIPNQPPLYPYLIMPIGELLDATHGVGQQATFEWDFALELEEPTLPVATEISDAFLAARLEASDPLTDVGRALNAITLFNSVDVSSFLTNAIKSSEETVTAIEGPVRLISLAGRLVALAVIAAAGMFAYTRRRVEARLLSAQGRTPWWQGAKAAVEAVLPATVGAAIGWFGGQALVGIAGPGDRISDGVATAALQEVVLWTLGSVVLLGIVYGVAAHQETQLGASRIRQVIGRIPWEVVLLVLAAASLYEVRTRQGAIVEASDKAAQIDLFLLAFPFLFLAGVSGLAARGLRRFLPRLRRGSGSRGAWSFIATRRFAGGQKVGFLLITASAVALGVLVYSATLVRTTETTVHSKAQVLAGSDVAAAIQNIDDVPDDFPFPSTHVALSSGDLLPGDERVSIVSIDPTTFERGAFWDPSFADEPLDELMAKLKTDGPRLPVILVAAAAPREATVDTRGIDIPISVVDTARAWPGLVPNRGLMVVDQGTFQRIAVDYGSLAKDPFATNELWVKGQEEEVFQALNEHELVVNSSRSAADVEDAPSLRSLTWTFGFLQALGLLSGLIAIIGLVLYLQSRQQAREVSYALARRMGLTRGAHRLAVGAELLAMLASSALIGGVTAIVAARLVAEGIDPLPGLPPGTLFRLPTPVIWGAPIVVLLVALLGAWRVQRRADRMNVAEVMRLAT